MHVDCFSLVMGEEERITGEHIVKEHSLYTKRPAMHAECFSLVLGEEGERRNSLLYTGIQSAPLGQIEVE